MPFLLPPPYSPVLTTCQIHRQESLASHGEAEDRYIAQCTADGSYAQVQCYEGQARYCWCVNEAGEEIAGTRRRDGQPDCTVGKTCITSKRQKQNFLSHMDKKYFIIYMFTIYMGMC